MFKRTYTKKKHKLKKTYESTKTLKKFWDKSKMVFENKTVLKYLEKKLKIEKNKWLLNFIKPTYVFLKLYKRILLFKIQFFNFE